jgi:hypothetical protein
MKLEKFIESRRRSASDGGNGNSETNDHGQPCGQSNFGELLGKRAVEVGVQLQLIAAPSLPDEGSWREMGRGGFQPFGTSIERACSIDKKSKSPLSGSRPVRSSRGESERASHQPLPPAPPRGQRSLERNDSVARQAERGILSPLQLQL